MSLPKTQVELTGEEKDISYSSKKTFSRILADKSKAKHTYQGIPEPEPDIKSLVATVRALKDVVEVLVGRKGSPTLQAVRVEDAIRANDELVKALIQKLGG